MDRIDSSRFVKGYRGKGILDRIYDLILSQVMRLPPGRNVLLREFLSPCPLDGLDRSDPSGQLNSLFFPLM